MKYLNVEIVREIIALAQAHYPVGGNARVVSVSDFLSSTIKEVPGDNELYQKIASLSSEQLAELHVLMLIGRGASEETPADWDYLYVTAIASQNPESVHYIASKYPLPRYLEKGLASLGL